MSMSSDTRAQINAQIGTLQAVSAVVSVLGRQFIRRHVEEGADAAAIAQANALVLSINNDIKVQENNLRSLLSAEE
jgi:hypothetical protein